jgi:opacity protein-like surface antigen
MRSVLSTGLALTVVALGAASSARAQRVESSQFAVDGALGFAVPVGNYGDAFNTGFDLMGAIEYHPRQTGPFYFRGEINWAHFGSSGGVNGHSNNVGFIADGLFDFPVAGFPLQPYALAGVGIYSVTAALDQSCITTPEGVSCTPSNGTSSVGLGFNLGGGLRYPIAPGLQAYFELRYHIPLTGPGDLSTAPFFPFQFGARYRLP